MSKRNKNFTIFKERFGMFEVRVTDKRLEIEEYIKKSYKLVFGANTKAYVILSYLLSDNVINSDGKLAKAGEEDREFKNKMLEFYIDNIFIFNNLILDSRFLDRYTSFLSDYLDSINPDEDTEETEEDIINSLKAEESYKKMIDEMKNNLKSDLQG